MEALWKLAEKKWRKISTQNAILLFTCMCIFITGLCMIAIILRKMAARRKTISIPSHTKPSSPDHSTCIEVSDTNRLGECGSIRDQLMRSLRCCEAKKWEEEEKQMAWGLRETPLPLLGVKGKEGEVGWGSHGSDSAVWKRPILMGEKCELPSFSGLILYDERGQPLQESYIEASHKGKTAVVAGTTLKDLLSFPF